MNGLPSILTTADSNFVQFFFEVESQCDDFVSGTSIWHQSDAGDPCENRTESMFVQSSPVIIDGADPADYAQFFVFANPVVAYCGAESTLEVTFLNVSETGMSQMSNLCMDLELSVFDYQAGSVRWVSPASHSPNFEETIGTDIVQVCLDIPDGI